MINYKITIPRAKPKHFAENLETRLFPYRWCRGQYIIVMPDKNAVIAITSDNGDLQGELNLVWEHILPVLYHMRQKNNLPRVLETFGGFLLVLALCGRRIDKGLKCRIDRQESVQRHAGIRSQSQQRVRGD